VDDGVVAARVGGIPGIRVAGCAAGAVGVAAVVAGVTTPRRVGDADVINSVAFVAYSNGLIETARLDASGTRSDANAAWSYNYRVSDVGATTVQRPDWASAPRPINDRSGLSKDARTIYIANETGARVPADGELHVYVEQDGKYTRHTAAFLRTSAKETVDGLVRRVDRPGDTDAVSTFVTGGAESNGNA
jgi:hypothetical protein